MREHRHHQQHGFGLFSDYNISAMVESDVIHLKKLHLKWLFTTKRNLSTVNMSRCNAVVWNVPWVHTETNTVGKSVLPTVCSLVLTASEPLSLICGCSINALLPGFEWTLAPLGEHAWLWSLPVCSLTATVKERIPALMDPQSRRVIIIYKAECDGWWDGGVTWGGGWSK